jgi:7-cyano-7-deazaguanine synthase
MNKKAVLLVSGGLDSAVAAAIAKKSGYDLYFLFFDYGQKTVNKEKICFLKLAKFYKAKEAKIISLPWVKKLGGSALTDDETILTPENFNLEYVPFRNTIFLSAAVAWAEVILADAVFIGSCGGDRICPDNSPLYINSFQKLVKVGTKLKTNIKIKAPLLRGDKTYVVAIGKRLGVPFELTWSCHNFTDRACGLCSNCLSRIKAFAENSLKDPIPYKLRK